MSGLASEDSLPKQEEKVVYTASSNDPASWRSIVLEHGGSRRRRGNLYGNEGQCLMAPREEVDGSCARLMESSGGFGRCEDCFECHDIRCIESIGQCEELLHETITECCVRNCGIIPLSTWLIIIGGGLLAILVLVLLGYFGRAHCFQAKGLDLQKLAQQRMELEGDVQHTPLNGAQLHLSGGGGAAYHWTILADGSFQSAEPSCRQEGKVHMDSPEKGLIRWVELPTRRRTREVIGELQISGDAVSCHCSFVEVQTARCFSGQWFSRRHRGDFILHGSLTTPPVGVAPAPWSGTTILGRQDESQRLKVATE